MLLQTPCLTLTVLINIFFQMGIKHYALRIFYLNEWVLKFNDKWQFNTFCVLASSQPPLHGHENTLHLWKKVNLTNSFVANKNTLTDISTRSLITKISFPMSNHEIRQIQSGNFQLPAPWFSHYYSGSSSSLEIMIQNAGMQNCYQQPHLRVYKHCFGCDECQSAKTSDHDYDTLPNN